MPLLLEERSEEQGEAKKSKGKALKGKGKALLFVLGLVSLVGCLFSFCQFIAFFVPPWRWKQRRHAGRSRLVVLLLR
jgi:hypothetical protein